MGYLRFHRRLRIVPDVRLDLAKTVVSLSFGRRGFTVTVGRNGVRFTAGRPHRCVLHHPGIAHAG